MRKWHVFLASFWEREYYVAPAISGSMRHRLFRTGCGLVVEFVRVAAACLGTSRTNYRHVEQEQKMVMN
jgi:hypothetical protein